MRNNMLHTPDGLRDLLTLETKVKADIIERIRQVFLSYAFMAVETPTLEYIDVFSSEIGSTNPKNMYKLFDRDGSTLALRADMTPPMARLSATAYSQEQILRLCYFEDVFQYGENFKGKLREQNQAGIELIGASSYDADAEVLAIAAKSLLATGLEDFKIDVGHVGFLKGLLEEARLDDEKTKKILEMLSVKDYISVEEAALSLPVPDGVRELMLDLTLLVGREDALLSAAERTKNKTALDALGYLKNIYNTLTAYGLEKYVTFDLGMVSHFDYYTGIVFRGYTYGTGFSILDGGRYDNLLSNFGQQKPSIGFAVKINDLMNALERQKIIKLYSDEKQGTLVVYTSSGKVNGIILAEYLRGQGICVENSLLDSSLEVNLDYAEKKGFEGMIYFKDESEISVYNLIDKSVTHTTINRLYESGAR